MFVCFIFEQLQAIEMINITLYYRCQIIKMGKILKNEVIHCTVLFTIQQLKQFLLQKCIGIPENRQWGQRFFKEEYEFMWFYKAFSKISVSDRISFQLFSFLKEGQFTYKGCLTQKGKSFEKACRSHKMENLAVVKQHNKNHSIFDTNFNIWRPVEMTWCMHKYFLWDYWVIICTI